MKQCKVRSFENVPAYNAALSPLTSSRFSSLQFLDWRREPFKLTSKGAFKYLHSGNYRVLPAIGSRQEKFGGQLHAYDEGIEQGSRELPANWKSWYWF